MPKRLVIIPSRLAVRAARLARTRAARSALFHLTSWHPWVVILTVGIIAVNVWTLTIYRAQTRDETARKTEKFAAAEATYSSCLRSIPFFVRFDAFIDGVAVYQEAQITNARATRNSTPTVQKHLRAVRQKNLDRLVAAKVDAAALRIPVPTKPSCEQRRASVLAQPSSR